MPKTRSGDVIYPDFYAGAYIGDDGRLVVLNTKPISILSNEKRYETFLSPLSEGLLNYKLAEFSYAELHEARDEYRILSDARLDVNCVYALNVVGSGIDYMQNALLIRLEEYCERKIEGFRKYVFDSPMLIFEQGNRHEPLIPKESAVDEPKDEDYASIVTQSVKVNPGGKVSSNYIFKGWNGGTMGYRVRRNSDNKIGFITSGHIFSDTCDKVYTGSVFSSSIGNIARRVLNSRIDASLVIANANNQDSIGNTLPNGRILSTYVPTSFFQNESVTMFVATTGTGVGRVRNVDYDTTIDGQLIKGTVWTTVVSNRGDSGGIVVVTSTLTAGIVWGGIPGAPDMIFIPAHRINSDLGVTRF